MNARSSHRLRIEGLEDRALLAACPVELTSAGDLSEPIEQTSAIVSDHVADHPTKSADAQLSVGLEAAKAYQPQVERPFKIKANSTMVLQPDGSYIGKGGGVATHLGRFTVEGWGQNGVGGSGYFTAANGDRLRFDDTPSGVATFTNGTGRFEGASGEFTFTMEMVGNPEYDPETGVTTMKFAWVGTGTIVY